MNRLTSMSVFVTVVDLGSFAAAGAELGLSAPMVGKHVQALESSLGVSLINRTTRRHVVTEVGRIYYDRCRTVLGEMEAADALAREHGGEPSGRLRVTAPVHFGRQCVMPVLLEMAAAYPRLRVEFAFSDRLTDVAEEGFDLAIRTGTRPEGAGLMTRRVARQNMIVCAAPKYLERHGAPLDIGDLSRHAVLSYRRAGPVSPWQFDVDGQTHSWTPDGRLRFDDLAAVADACEAGYGLGWLPSWMVRPQLARGSLMQMLTQYPGFPYEAHALWPQSRHMPLRVRHAIDALAARLPGLM